MSARSVSRLRLGALHPLHVVRPGAFQSCLRSHSLPGILDHQGWQHSNYSQSQNCNHDSPSRPPSGSSHAELDDHAEARAGQDDQPAKIPMDLQTRLSRRICLLTGATSGIGYAVLKHLIVESVGHIRLVVRDTARGMDVLRRAAEETGRKPVSATIFKQDLETISSPEFPSEMLTVKVGDDRLKVNTFIHCAGISQQSLSIRTRADTSSKILSTNLESHIAIASHMLKQYVARSNFQRTEHPSTCVIGVSSLLALRDGFGASSYAASKAGLIAFNRSLCVEAAAFLKKTPEKPDFRVNTVMPGYINTPMLGIFDNSKRQKLEASIPARRFGTPDEVAEAVMFLLKNEYANNSVLNLDGGLSAR